MLVGNDVVGGTAFHEIDDILLTEVFLHGSHSLQYHNQGILSLKLHGRMQTVVAIVAVFHIIFFSEIMEQHLAAAD